MNNFIELKFEPIAGDAYNVELRGGIEGKSSALILRTQIPAFDPDRYRLYQQACRQLYERHARIGLKSTSVITAADLAQVRQNLDTSDANLLNAFNRWGASPQFAEIAQAIADRSENLRVIIFSECANLRKLPFHKWNLFPDGVEVIFSGIGENRDRILRSYQDKIRILFILGDSRGIDLKVDRETIERYCKKNAELEILSQPSRVKLETTLADIEGWDIVFFSGHSCTENTTTGRIYINETDSLTMNELHDVLKPSIEHRVQIAIFNSCDGLGIAPVLEKLNIDRIIVMREPIPDQVAQEFLKSFLQAFTQGNRFDDAAKTARQQLVNLEDNYPYASWLPIVIQNPLVFCNTTRLADIGNQEIYIDHANRAKEIYARFVVNNLGNQFKQVYCRLIPGNGTTDFFFHFDSTISDIATRAEIGEDNWREIVVPLAAERFLTTDRDEQTGVETVKVIPDTIFDYWERLRNWNDEYREELQRIKEIEAAARKWEENNKSKQELWQNKKLKDGRKFVSSPDRILQLLPIAKDFLAASNKQQLWNQYKLCLLLTILAGIGLGWFARESLIRLHIRTIEGTDKKMHQRFVESD